MMGVGKVTSEKLIEYKNKKGGSPFVFWIMGSKLNLCVDEVSKSRISGGVIFQKVI